MQRQQGTIKREAIKYAEDDHNYGNNYDALLKLFQDTYEGKVTPVIPTHLGKRS